VQFFSISTKFPINASAFSFVTFQVFFSDFQVQHS